jgi:hypothetical protein
VLFRKRSSFVSFRIALLVSAAGAVIALAIGTPEARAFPTYSGWWGGECRTCHGDFEAPVYLPPSRDQEWTDLFGVGALHGNHWRMVGFDCGACHPSGNSGRHHLRYDQPIPPGSVVPFPDTDGDGFPDASYSCLSCHGDEFTVFRDCLACHNVGGPSVSNGAVVSMSESESAAFPMSCIGCHGRAEHDAGGLVTAAGLRRHHWNAGVPCTPCHVDSDPGSGFAPVSEAVLPPNYAALGIDPLNRPPDFSEDFAGSPLGLDNDGDGIYDEADPSSNLRCGLGSELAVLLPPLAWLRRYRRRRYSSSNGDWGNEHRRRRPRRLRRTGGLHLVAPDD